MESKSKNDLLLKVGIFVVAVFILFLFALNGRYERLHDGYVLDKWKKEVNLVGSDELPVIFNGEKE